MTELDSLLTAIILFPKYADYNFIRNNIIEYLEPINDINQKKIVVQQAMEYAVNNLEPQVMSKLTND